MTAPRALAERYSLTLVDYLAGAGESALLSAYQFGRRAMDQGFSVLDITFIHQDALRRILQRARDQEDTVRISRCANEFLVESL
ncbi:MAG TPA: phosphatase RsbU N-terminal domain-containing protein, partial [Nitrospiria bacterium]|nr:phosphatase RsbU N-terminal domain-containing protein [Nitrospiria bacterium]